MNIRPSAVMLAAVIGAAGCSSAGSTQAQVTTAAPVTSALAASTAASQPPGCTAQVITWRGDGGTHDLTAVAGDENKLIGAGKTLGNAISNGTGMSAAESGLQTAAASLQADAEAAEADPPPGCVPGMRADWRAAMTDYATAALSYQDAVSELSSGQDAAALGDLNSGNKSAGKGSGKLDSAAKDLQRYEG